MKGSLNRNSRYSEIKKFFEDNKALIPKTLDGNSAYYYDVKFTINVNINRIESEINRIGIQNLAKSRIALSSKQSLLRIYDDLQNKEGYNKDLPQLDSFYNKNQ